MCFKYEDQYKGQCWDYLFFTKKPEFIEIDAGYGKMVKALKLPTDHQESLVDMLRDIYNVKVVDKHRFAQTILDCFRDLHDDGVIAPMEE